VSNNLVRVIDNPLQSPGKDKLVRKVVTAGPEMEGDRRIYLSRRMLEHCLEVAKSSPTGRAQLDRAGLEVGLYEDAHGHRYEVWTFTGLGPKPEPLPPGLAPIVGG
jgi:hypothetical protein